MGGRPSLRQEKGEIPFHMLGTHRRIDVLDVLAHKIQRSGRRRRILDDLCGEVAPL